MVLGMGKNGQQRCRVPSAPPRLTPSVIRRTTLCAPGVKLLPKFAKHATQKDFSIGTVPVFLTCVSHTTHVIAIGWTSVYPLHAGILSQLLSLSSDCLHCLVAPWNPGHYPPDIIPPGQNPPQN